MIVNFDVTYFGHFLLFNKWLGITYLAKRHPKCDNRSLPEEIAKPFLVHQRRVKSIEVKISSYSKIYAHFLVWTARYCYPLIYLLSHLRLNMYDDAQQASWVFQQCTKGMQQKLLCLSRSIFIATTSKRFKEHGTMYIGIFLPSRNMHAWVIEDNLQTDEWDNYWILYQPLIMMRG